MLKIKRLKTQIWKFKDLFNIFKIQESIRHKIESLEIHSRFFLKVEKRIRHEDFKRLTYDYNLTRTILILILIPLLWLRGHTSVGEPIFPFLFVPSPSTWLIALFSFSLFFTIQSQCLDWQSLFSTHMAFVLNSTLIIKISVIFHFPFLSSNTNPLLIIVYKDILLEWNILCEVKRLEWSTLSLKHAISYCFNYIVKSVYDLF